MWTWRRTMVFDVGDGETNMLYVPGQFGEFNLGQRAKGVTFEILFHPAYCQGLAERYPALIAPYLDRLSGVEMFWLSNQPERIAIDIKSAAIPVGFTSGRRLNDDSRISDYDVN